MNNKKTKKKVTQVFGRKKKNKITKFWKFYWEKT